MFNVLPTNDLREHLNNSSCDCLPKVIFENGEMIVVHNSFDGREGLELYNELINNKHDGTRQI